MKNFKTLLVALCLFSFCPFAQGFVSPIGLSIVPPVQFPSHKFSVVGVRASVLWGQHRDVYGIDVGAIGNRTDQDFIGLGISGLFNWTEGETKIAFLQGAGFININSKKAKIYGLQVAGGANYNSADSSTVGFQLALANLSTHGRVYGAQIGAYNKAHKVYGLQIGIVNYATELHGIQIGLINFHHKGTVSVSPILNIGF